MLALAMVAMVAGSAACKRDDGGKAGPSGAKAGSTPPSATSANAATAGSAAKPVAIPDPACGKAYAEAGSPIPWVHDDYASARACARSIGKPLVIDMWAPWCHTCLSMKHTVLVDPGLAPLADRFVWLAVDTDREINAEVTGKLAVRAWPTFFVISPDDESVQARFLGAASLTQFRDFLDAGEQGYLDARALTGGAAAAALEPALVAMRNGDRAELAGDLDGAATAYGEALVAAAPSWPRRPDLLVSLAGVLAKREAYADCFAVASQHLDKTGSSASASDLLYYGGDCATQLLAHGGDAAAVKAFRQRAIARLQALVDDAAAPLSVDDRSDALANLRGYHDAHGDSAAAKAAAERQRALLDDAAAKAPTPFAAMTYNWPRAEVYVYLGQAAALVPALEQSAKDLPAEYDPPYRLGWVLLKSGKTAPALVAAERALALAYGPRKGRVAALVADIHKARGDVAAEKAARAAVVAIYEQLPAGQKAPVAEQAARDALAGVGKPASGVAK